MDKGAHFYKCDFQVHTPRDAQWHGDEASTATDRKAYAEDLIQACRAKGLGAIAITDHHDFAFFPYVKAAAESEVDAVGNPIPKQSRIVVFPGMELTLSSPPCQAILLLSSDFDENKFGDIITTLALEATDEAKSKLPSVDSVSPTSVTGFNDLENKLNLHKWLKGKFIILPNVTDGGYKTLFRDGLRNTTRRCGVSVDTSMEATEEQASVRKIFLRDTNKTMDTSQSQFFKLRTTESVTTRTLAST